MSKYFTTGEMIDFTRSILSQKDIFLAYGLTAPYVEVLRALQEELSRALQSPTLSDEERKKISLLLGEVDEEFDDLGRALHGVFGVMPLLFPDRAEEYNRADHLIFPRGLTLITSSYRNEAGEVEQIKQRLERHPDVAETLKNSSVNGVPLENWYNRFIDAGERIGPLLDRYELPPQRKDDVVKEFLVRRRWTSTISTLLRTTEIAGWTEEEQETVFGPMRRLAHERALEARKKNEPADDS